MAARAAGSEPRLTLRRPSRFEPDAELGNLLDRITAGPGSPVVTAAALPPQPWPSPAQEGMPRKPVPRSRPRIAAPEAAPVRPADAAPAGLTSVPREPPATREIPGDGTVRGVSGARDGVQVPGAATPDAATPDAAPMPHAAATPEPASGPSAAPGDPPGVALDAAPRGQPSREAPASRPGERPRGAATGASAGPPGDPADGWPGVALSVPPDGPDLDPVWLIREHVLPVLVERGALGREQPADVLSRAQAAAPGRTVAAVTAGRVTRTGPALRGSAVPPEVHVHIDRIEVHHPPTPAAAARPAPRPGQAPPQRPARPARRPPAADLSAYLARRRETR
jgi:hypothetical protein